MRPPSDFLRAAAILVAISPLTACMSERSDTAIPSLYLALATPAAQVDAMTARDMISSYRGRTGLVPLTVDPQLQRLAEAEAAAMAAADRPSRADTVKAAIERLGFAGAEANLSAGYHTLAEAFSGWRESKGHDAVMRAPDARRMGIATAYAPNSKYKVYWALLVAK
ncbi:MAG: CAP domain-containing protein [Methylobacterium sp.]|nr:CAP domain-containing protein [Methylobacterium sp.]